MLDIFHEDAFGVIPLTDAINKPVYQPGRLGQMGIFMETSVTTVDIAIEEKEGILILVPPTPRGGPGTTLPKPGRALRVLRAPHFEINDAVMAEEVQGVRAWGSENDVQMVMDKVAERIVIHRGSHEATMEYARVGAVGGIITYADGSKLDLFKEFDVTQEPVVDFDLDNANPVGGALRAQVHGSHPHDVAQHGRRAVHGRGVDLRRCVLRRVARPSGSACHVLEHAVRRRNCANRTSTTTATIYGTFPFGGIVWENYRGYVGGTEFIEPDKCHLFPTGTPNLFKTYMAPADYNETVNRPGQRIYVKQYDMPNDKGVHFDSQNESVEHLHAPESVDEGPDLGPASCSPITGRLRPSQQTSSRHWAVARSCAPSKVARKHRSRP